MQIDDILNSLVDHYHKYGRVTEENVQSYIDRETEMMIPEGQQAGAEDVIVYGTKGTPIKAKTVNQQKLVQLVKDNDLVFALGPAGTG